MLMSASISGKGPALDELMRLVFESSFANSRAFSKVVEQPRNKQLHDIRWRAPEKLTAGGGFVFLDSTATTIRIELFDDERFNEYVYIAPLVLDGEIPSGGISKGNVHLLSSIFDLDELLKVKPPSP